jgi:hypothetical protein
MGPHTRGCNVCRHPHRNDIDQEFLRWRSPDRIARDCKIRDHSSLSRVSSETPRGFARSTQSPYRQLEFCAAQCYRGLTTISLRYAPSLRRRGKR